MNRRAFLSVGAVGAGLMVAGTPATAEAAPNIDIDFFFGRWRRHRKHRRGRRARTKVKGK